MPPFLAIDWGTTNRRVCRVDPTGAGVRTQHDDRGVLAMRGTGYAVEFAELRARYGDLPILCAGMVGSNIGWRPAPYVKMPVGIETLAAATVEVADRIWIVPGVSKVEANRGDVMRGEEVQFLGAALAGLVPRDALLCQPGTHCKWATLRGGEIADFTTAMTGELFALLKTNGLLAAELTAPVVKGAPFYEGVDDAKAGDLLACLFGVRAASVLGLRVAEEYASYASGLLIGSDVAARMATSAEERVFVLSDVALGWLYVSAIAAHGREAVLVDSHQAFLAGITRIWSHIA